MVGESTRAVHYQRPADVAYEDVKRAFTEIGKVLEASPLTRTVMGRTRFGLQSIRLRVAVHAVDDQSSRVDIQSFGDDLWGGGARRGADKLVRALGR